MSVPKSKRGKSKMEVITKVNELTEYTIHICSNEKNFPKRYRWCLTSKIIDTVIDVNKYVVMAKSVQVDDENSRQLRKNYQNLSLVAISSLLSLMNISYKVFCIEGDRINYWTSLVVEVQSLVQEWKNSDK